MKLNIYLLVGILSASLAMFSGCATENRTIYEKATSGSKTTTPLAGKAQFEDSCMECHTVASKSKLTLAGIKASGMTRKLNDAQLQAIVDYLATQ